ncbi:MAG: Ig-like domain-containing protein [Gemmatimonadota bacterium]
MFILYLLPLLLAGCGGDNLFRDPAGIAVDRDPPGIRITDPAIGHRVAVGDSILVRIDVEDDAGIESVLLSGFAVRGSAELGTAIQIPRFEPKQVDFTDEAPLVRDTSLARYLIATGDTLPADTVFIVANVTDVVGNERADTLHVAIGGPRVAIVAPTSGTEVRAGAVVPVRVTASDNAGLQSLRLALSGDLEADTLLAYDQPLATVDTVVRFEIPEGSSTGELELRAIATNSVNDSTVSQVTRLSLLALEDDTDPPSVRFRFEAVERAELRDFIVVSVAASDDTRVDRVGITFAASHRLVTGTEPLDTISRSAATDSATFRIALDELGLDIPADTSTVRIELTAFAFDQADNCGAATVPETALSMACDPQGDVVLASGPGARMDVLLVRGTTAQPEISSDRLVDLVADEARERILISNFSRNRVEVLPFDSATFTDSVRVGAEPWGLTTSVDGDTLFAANSAGTNISVVPLAELEEVEPLRIAPADIQLYGVDYDVATDSVGTVTVHDYSDRPQFLGRLSSGQLVYSTKPTSVREPGTIRIIDAANDQTREFNRGSEIFVDYATTAIGRAIVVNALSVAVGTEKVLTVCPRRLTSAQQDPACVTGGVSAVSGALAELADDGLTDTRVDLSREIGSIALTDTTFVAVSRDNSTVAFGEGATSPGRVFLFKNLGGELHGSSTETADLVGNAAERVIGLGLNGDGSLGAARGQRAYFFDSDLRLTGQVDSGVGTPTGGVALHPLDTGYPLGNPLERRGFVAGVDEEGSPFIDVIDTFSFVSLRRVYIRDRIVGTLIATPGSGDIAVRLFAITESGVVQVGLRQADLQ